MTSPAPPVPLPSRPWSPIQRAGFRFAFGYLVLYNLPFPLSLPPLGGPVARVYDRFWHAVIPWFGSHVLRLSPPITVFPSGTGDTRYNYVQLLVFALLAAVGAVIWSVADRGRPDYRRLHHWLRVYLRYALAVALITYGAAKVVKLQFPAPSLGTMLRPFGELSPQEALWAWMGVSYGYNLFAGLAEMIPGVLLLFRKTATLGALLGAAALANVVVLNFAYDVPVKLFSSHLELMALFLLVPDLGRLTDLLVRNRPVPAADLGPEPATPRLRAARIAVKSVVVAVAIVLPVLVSWNYASRYGDRAPRPPLYGIYDVASFVRNRDSIPPLATDSARWERLIISRPGVISVRFMNGRARGFRAVIDTAGKRLMLAGADSASSSLAYTAAGDSLSLDGIVDGDTLHLRLRRENVAAFPIMSGFRWVRE